jgi:hypothetical protein
MFYQAVSFGTEITDGYPRVLSATKYCESLEELYKEMLAEQQWYTRLEFIITKWETFVGETKEELEQKYEEKMKQYY